MKNPWTTLSNTTVYENPWIKVEHREVIAPTGKPGIYGLVHMQNRAIGIVPLDNDGYTWLVGQYRYATEEYSWEIPMGGGPLSETPLQSAQRELEEEVGVVAADWELLLELQLSNCVTSERAWVFLATNLSVTHCHPDDTELLTLRRLPLKEAVEMAARGEITDAVSVAALLKLAYSKRMA